MDDVCLIVESDGDVRTAGIPRHAFELIEALQHISFSVVTIAHRVNTVTSLIAKLPPNVRQLLNISLDEEYVFSSDCPMKKKRKEFWKNLASLYAAPLEEKLRHFEDVFQALADHEHRVQSYKDIVSAEEFWNIMCAQYQRYCADVPFLDYVWIFRQTQLPFYQLTQIDLPKAKVYHAFASRYGGCAGLMAKIRHRAHLIFDIREDFFIDEENVLSRLHSFPGTGSLSELSPRSIDAFIKTYNSTLKTIHYLAGFYADTIIAKKREDHQTVLKKELEFKFLVIPSGVEQIAENPVKSSPKDAFTVGLVSDFTPESDIKSFIRASRIVLDEVKNIRFSLLGIENIHTLYAEECNTLRNQLGLELDFEIYYNRDIERYFGDCDIVVLTAKKMDERKTVLCQALSTGKPIIAVRRGSFPAIIQGQTPDDRALGECGILVESGSPQELARAVLIINGDRRLAREMGKIAQRRFELFYSHSIHISSYVSLYNNYF